MKEKKNGFVYERSKDKTLEDTFTDKSKRDKEDYKNITFFLEKGLHADFKSYCAQSDTTMTDVLVEYIRSVVQKNNKITN